jgi:hypothetical protein
MTAPEKASAGRGRLASPSRILGLLCLLAAGGALAWALRPAPAGVGSRPVADPAGTAATPPAAPYVVFANMSPDAYRRVALAPLGAPDASRYLTPLSCDRVHVANGRGICLTTSLDGMATVHRARLFDAAFRETASATLTGVPSRARVAPDGRLGAVTVFEAGHAYDEAGFATRTSILDLARGVVLTDLEQFTVLRDGRPFTAVDFNFWGVTFAADSDRFFATLATGGIPYLVEGRVSDRRIRIIGATGECPSLSPDNTRLAYKHRLPGSNVWQVRVIDLATRAVTPLTGETRSVDDQVEWRDDTRVLYHVTGSGGADVWQLETTAPGQPPVRLVPSAYSPAVVR